MSDANPYNCTRPGNLFVGHERLRNRVLDGLKNGASFAILGGRRCGKTSTLLQLAKDLERDGLSPYQALPCFLDIQGVGSITANRLFQEIYELATRGIDAVPWSSASTGEEYKAFLAQFEAATAQLAERHGDRWLVVLLVDELDSAAAALRDDYFFQNLRNLLMVSPFHSHFRLIASGVTEMAGLIRSGSSPLNNLRVMHLGILGSKSARELIHAGCEAGLDLEAELEIDRLTGRHPYLMQGLLEKIWPERDTPLDRVRISRLARQFLQEHRDFQRWLDTFGEAEKAAYHCLAGEPEGGLHVSELGRRLEPGLVEWLDDALTVLSYHGVIDDQDPEEPRVAGTMFRDWFRRSHPLGPTAHAAETESADPADQHIERAIHIEVSPHIEVGVSPTVVTLSATDALEVIDDLVSLVSTLPLDARSGMASKHALEEARLEAELEAKGGAGDKAAITQSIERTTEVLKAAGAGADALQTFIDKARRLAPYVGRAGDWLSTFL